MRGCFVFSYFQPTSTCFNISDVISRTHGVWVQFVFFRAAESRFVSASVRLNFCLLHFGYRFFMILSTFVSLWMKNHETEIIHTSYNYFVCGVFCFPIVVLLWNFLSLKVLDSKHLRKFSPTWDQEMEAHPDSKKKVEGLGQLSLLKCNVTLEKSSGPSTIWKACISVFGKQAFHCYVALLGASYSSCENLRQDFQVPITVCGKIDWQHNWCNPWVFQACHAIKDLEAF